MFLNNNKYCCFRFTVGSNKLERCITEWSDWIKTAAEHRSEVDDQWEPDERPSGLTRMVTFLN